MLLHRRSPSKVRWVREYSLLAGMIHGLLSSTSPEETLKTATAIASNAVTQIGFALPDFAVIEDLKSQISVQSLS